MIHAPAIGCLSRFRSLGRPVSPGTPARGPGAERSQSAAPSEANPPRPERSQSAAPEQKPIRPPAAPERTRACKDRRLPSFTRCPHERRRPADPGRPRGARADPGPRGLDEEGEPGRRAGVGQSNCQRSYEYHRESARPRSPIPAGGARRGGGRGRARRPRGLGPPRGRPAISPGSRGTPRDPRLCPSGPGLVKIGVLCTRESRSVPGLSSASRSASTRSSGRAIPSRSGRRGWSPPRSRGSSGPSPPRRPSSRGSSSRWPSSSDRPRPRSSGRTSRSSMTARSTSGSGR